MMEDGGVRLQVTGTDRELADLFDAWVAGLDKVERRQVLYDLERIAPSDRGGRQYKVRVPGIGVVGAKALMVRLMLVNLRIRENVRDRVVRGERTYEYFDVADLQGCRSRR